MALNVLKTIPRLHIKNFTHTAHMIQGRQRSRHGDNHRETSNHNRSLERRAQGKATFTDRVMDRLLSRQTES